MFYGQLREKGGRRLKIPHSKGVTTEGTGEMSGKSERQKKKGEFRNNSNGGRLQNTLKIQIRNRRERRSYLRDVFVLRNGEDR